MMAHPVAAAAQREGQVVRHAQQLPEEDAVLRRGAQPQRRHARHRPLHARLRTHVPHDQECSDGVYCVQRLLVQIQLIMLH